MFFAFILRESTFKEKRFANERNECDKVSGINLYDFLVRESYNFEIALDKSSGLIE